MHINKNKLPKVQPVKLKPLFGLKPGQWLTILYTLTLALLIFLVGILPDLLHPSERVTFTSKVGNAAVYMDGNYIGGTPFTTRVPSGSHSFEFSVNGCEIDSFESKVSKHVFFAWLFPRKSTITSNKGLTQEACRALTTEFLTDTASYSAILEYDNVNHYPALYTNWAQSVKDCQYMDLSAFDAALEFVSTDEMKADAQNACVILGINRTITIESSSVNSVVEPECIMDRKDGSYLIDGTFHTSRLPVSESEFAQFLSENPKWSASNKTSLIAEGLVDRYYLEDFTGSSVRPVHNISRYAAQAYCQWMSAKTGKTVKLPTETQWMQICKAADTSYQKTLVNGSKSLLPTGLLGGLWEMTDTTWVPGNRTDNPAQQVLASYGVNAEFVVKGGSYENSASSIKAETAGTAPWSMCSDYMGFRTIWY